MAMMEPPTMEPPTMEPVNEEEEKEMNIIREKGGTIQMIIRDWETGRQTPKTLAEY